MAGPDTSTLTALVLRVATQLIEGIHDGVTARGFTDVRPAHGFAFARISAGGATTVEIAEHLGVTKQAASQLVEQLVQRGYVRREPDPADGRARRLQLTERGWACTRAAEQAAADLITTWQERAGAQTLANLHQGLRAVAEPGPLRPAW
jgi:DNA-binding MarR family transcriptional regulator